MNDHRRLRGVEGIAPGITNSTIPAAADQTIEAQTGHGYRGDPLSLIICIVVLVPCVLACFFQMAWKMKKRRMDRVEREILEVTTNPTSRRIVLDEIFKGSSKLVESPSNKRRVQVKKRRKKTAEERRLGSRSKEVQEPSLDNEGQAGDEEIGSVQGRMIICISDKKSEEHDTSDDASASSIDSSESVNYSDNSKCPSVVAEEEPLATVSTTVALEGDAGIQGRTKKISPTSPQESLAEETSKLTKLSIPDVGESTGNTLVLFPKISPNPHDELEDEKKGQKFVLVPSSCQEIDANKTSLDLVIPIISDDDDTSNDEDEEKLICQTSIFRNETQSETKIETLTELTSNVVDTAVTADVLPPSLERLQTASCDLGIGDEGESKLELKNPIPLKNVDSIKTDTSSKAETSSHISYVSFEDETIASDQAEQCAICICPYDEGDIRIFSKRCPHAFHKDCLFEWLVKGHDECPCCRSEMISKDEVKEISASLVGTERLAQALADHPNLVEARVSFPQARIARQMFARARERRRRSTQNENNSESAARQNAINSHWIWNARFEATTNPASSEQRANLTSVNEAFPQPAGLRQSSPVATTNQVTPPSTPLQTRSFDLITDSQPAENLASRSFDAITETQQTGQAQRSPRPVASNPRNFHSHWANWNHAQQRTPRRSNRIQTPSPAATSPLGRLRRTSPSESLPVTILPTI